MTEFLYNLSASEIKFLNDDNSHKKENKNQKEQTEHLGQTFIREKETNRETVLINDLNKDIEIKKNFLSNISTSKQESLKTLNLSLLKRNIVLRDAKGSIDHFNLNYHPIHTKTMKKITENNRSNFLVQEISKTLVSENGFERNIKSKSILASLSSYMKSQDINYAVVNEIFKLNQGKVENYHQQNIEKINSNNSELNQKKILKNANFIPYMIEKLELKDDADLINEMLWPLFNLLSDEEINHLWENPKLFLNFIHNDNKVFDIKDEPKKNQGQERKFINIIKFMKKCTEMMNLR